MIDPKKYTISDVAKVCILNCELCPFWVRENDNCLFTENPADWGYYSHMANENTTKDEAQEKPMPPEEAPDDDVNHPSHYCTGEIEVIDYIRDKLDPDEFIGYCVGNVMKYVSRWRHKGGVKDLGKASVYLDWAIEAARKHINME